MKKLLLIAATTLVCVGAFAQGKLIFNVNSDNLIYVTTDVTKLSPGAAALTADNQFGAGPVALPGSSLYSGVNSTAAALGGTWVVSLMGGTSSSSLSLQTTASLADVSSGNCGGIASSLSLTLAGMPSGTAAFFQVDVSNGAGYSGQSILFSAVTQNVYSPIYQTETPVNSTWTPGTQELSDYVANFGTGSGYLGGIAVTYSAVPEPGTFALAGLGLAALLVFRRRN